MKTFNKTIFIFRRSYRLHDNIGLIQALKQSKQVIPIFIFTPKQLVNNTYKSDNCVQFMIESLMYLDKELKKKGSRLFYFYGKPASVIDNIIKSFKHDIDAVFVNMDYTPYSKKRDTSIQKVCRSHKINFETLEDILLNPVKSILTQNESVYQKFTPYFNVAKKKQIPKPTKNNYNNYYKKRNKIPKEYTKNIHQFYEHNDDLAVNGGRHNALKILKNIPTFKKYNTRRNILNISTTKLSAYIKFGCVSIREVFHSFKSKLGHKNDLIKQLYWRDFYYNVSYEYSRVFKKGQNLKEHYNKIKWLNNRTHINRWKNGTTGYPIIDASMREMNITGFMHNRGRLLVSNFLVKVLGIDWKIGEKYFAQMLVDYDPSVNNGNWGWSSGSGADSQPYFRIFNPWLQSKRYDIDAVYIKRWVHELENVDPPDIHKWFDVHSEYDIDYPKPMVNYKAMKQKTLSRYKKALY